MNYVTTNIRLPEDDYLRLKSEAAQKRTSLAAVIREKIGSRKKISSKEYAKVLLSVNTDWFTEKDYKDYQKMRSRLKKRTKRYDW